MVEKWWEKSRIKRLHSVDLLSSIDYFNASTETIAVARGNIFHTFSFRLVLMNATAQECLQIWHKLKDVLLGLSGKG